MTSKPSLGLSLPLALGFLTAVLALAQLGVAERAGEALDNAGRSMRRGVETTIVPAGPALVYSTIIMRWGPGNE